MLYPVFLLWWLHVAPTVTWSAHAATDATEATAATNKQLSNDAFIIECSNKPCTKIVGDRVEAAGGTVRGNFDSPIFTGLSAQLPHTVNKEEQRSILRHTDGVIGMWMLESNQRDTKARSKRQLRTGIPKVRTETAESDDMQSPGLNLSAHILDISPQWSHVQTQIDKLRAEGLRGSDITIAMIDTGVDYRHPALGGCFGEGCHVAFGLNLLDDGESGDPKDCTPERHGTTVGGILGGYHKEGGFVGVAPNATLGAYRVVGCDSLGEEDDMLAGWLKAYEDGAQIITSSAGLQTQNWVDRPLALVASRIASKGVPCIVGLGNERWKGLFHATNPSTGLGVISVNSFGRRTTNFDQRGTYSTGNGNHTIEFAFGLKEGASLGWDTAERTVHDVDADFGDKPDDTGDHVTATAKPYDPENPCRPSPGNDSQSQDLIGRVALIRHTPRTNKCGFVDRVRNAVARGAKHILAWEEGDDPRLLLNARDAKTIGATDTVGITTSAVGKQMAQALAAGKQVTMRRTGYAHIEGGDIGRLSAFGPTWSLDIKPSIGAPGEKIYALTEDGGYALGSDTSFAAPLVAGVVALVGEARGSFDPSLIESLLITTATPQADSHGFLSVAQQGGGLLRAWDAAHATTLITPAGLAFNDTDHRVQSISLEITNSGKSVVSYRLSNKAATTLYTLTEDLKLAEFDVKVAQAVAEIRLSRDSLTLQPGQAASVEVSAVDPQGLDLARLPLWSGWIAVGGSDGKNLTVPYLGLAGSLRSASMISQKPVRISYEESSHSTLADFKQLVFPDPPTANLPGSSRTKEDWGMRHLPSIWIRFDLALDTTELRLVLVATDKPGETNTTRADGDVAVKPHIQGSAIIDRLPGYPKYLVQRGSLKVEWSGLLASGQYAQPGTYKIVAQALSVMGDASNSSHWDTVHSTTFSIFYEHNVVSVEEDFWANYQSEGTT